LIIHRSWPLEDCSKAESNELKKHVNIANQNITVYARWCIQQNSWTFNMDLIKIFNFIEFQWMKFLDFESVLVYLPFFNSRHGSNYQIIYQLILGLRLITWIPIALDCVWLLFEIIVTTRAYGSRCHNPYTNQNTSLSFYKTCCFNKCLKIFMKITWNIYTVFVHYRIFILHPNSI